MSEVKDANDTYLFSIIFQIWKRGLQPYSLREYGNGSEYVDKYDTTDKSKDISNNWIILFFRAYIFTISYLLSSIITYIIHYGISGEKFPKDLQILMIVYGVVCIWLIISMIFFHSRLEK